MSLQETRLLATTVIKALLVIVSVVLLGLALAVDRDHALWYFVFAGILLVVRVALGLVVPRSRVAREASRQREGEMGHDDFDEAHLRSQRRGYVTGLASMMVVLGVVTLAIPFPYQLVTGVVAALSAILALVLVAKSRASSGGEHFDK
ncbi:MAG: hypothetical protein ACOH1T_02100 [Microbacteriaceae bacterium]